MKTPEKLSRGIVLMIGAQSMLMIMAALVRALKNLPFMEIVFLRSLFGLVIFVPFMAAQNFPFKGKKQRELFLRGISGFLALCTYYYSITHVSLAAATLLVNIAPLLVTLLGALFLQEKVKPLSFSLILLCLYGVYLLIRPEFSVNIIGYVSGLASAVFTAYAFFFIRKLSAENTYTIVFYFLSIASLAALPWAIQIWQWPTSMGWLLLAGVGATSFFGQLWLTRAFRHGSAAIISTVGYVGPVIAWFIGIVAFGESLNTTASLGALLILSSGATFIYLNKT